MIRRAVRVLACGARAHAECERARRWHERAGPSACGGVGDPGKFRAGAQSVGPGPGVVPGYAEAGKGAGCVRPCHSWLLLCGCGVV